MKPLWLSFVCVGVGLWPSQARAERSDEPVLPEVLTLPRALEIFEAYGYDLLRADAAVASAEGDLASARALRNPTVTGGIGHAGGHYHPRSACNGTRGCSATQVQIQVGESGFLSDLISGRRTLRSDVARHALVAAEAGRADTWRTLKLLVQQQFLAVAVDAKNVAFADEVQQSYRRTAELFANRYQAGAISEADLARVETAAMESEQASDVAREQERLDLLGLSFLLGVRRSPAPFSVDGNFLSEPAQIPQETQSLGALIDYAREHRPDLRQERTLLRGAERQLQLARRFRVPEFDFNLGYLQQGDGNLALQPPTYTATMTLALPVWYQFQGEIGRARAEKTAAQVSRDRSEGVVANDVAAAKASLEATDRRLTRMRDRLRQRARRAWELVHFQYTKGAASLVDLLDAQRTFIQVNEEYFADLGAYWQAHYALEGALAAEPQS